MSSDEESSESSESEEDEDRMGGPKGFFDLEAKEVDEDEVAEEEKRSADLADAEDREGQGEKKDLKFLIRSLAPCPKNNLFYI